MAGIEVTKAEFEALLDKHITDASFNAADRLALRLIRGATRVDVDSSTGRASEVLTNVYTSILIRLFTNPTGVSLLALGSAQVSFGGGSSPTYLTDEEKSELLSLRAGKPSYVVHTSLIDPILLAPVDYVEEEE